MTFFHILHYCLVIWKILCYNFNSLRYNTKVKKNKKWGEYMKKKKKLLLIILGIVLLIGGASILLVHSLSQEKEPVQSPSPENPEVKQNMNSSFTEDKIINNITFTNINCTYDGVNSLLEYTITNQTNESVRLGAYEIVIRNKDKQILANLSPSLEQELAPGESVDTGNAVNIDLTGAYSMELILAE